MKFIFLLFFTGVLLANTGVVDLPRLFYSHPKMDSYDELSASFRNDNFWYGAKKEKLEKRREILQELERDYIFRLSGFFCKHEEYKKQFFMARQELFNKHQLLSPKLLKMASEYRQEKQNCRAEFLALQASYQQQRDNILKPFWLSEEEKKQVFFQILREIISLIRLQAQAGDFDLVFNSPFSDYSTLPVFESRLSVIGKSLSFLDFSQNEPFYYLSLFKGEPLVPSFSAQRKDLTMAVLTKLRPEINLQSKEKITVKEKVFIAKDRNRLFFLELQKLQAGNEIPIQKNRVAFFRKRLIELMHPLMIGFDFEENGFKSANHDLYVNKDFYQGITDYLKSAARFLSSDQLESEFSILSGLSAIGLETPEKNNELLAQIEQDIFNISEELREKHGYQLVFYENIILREYPQLAALNMNIISTDIPDISFPILEILLQRYAVSQERSREIITQLRDILITGDKLIE